MREAVQVLFAQADLFEQFDHTRTNLRFGQHMVRNQRLGHDLLDFETRAERGKRVLENYLHLLAHLAHFGAFECGQVTPIEKHLPGGRLEQAQDNPPQSGLTAARFADQTESLAGGDFKIDAIDGVHKRGLPESQPPTRR